MGELETERCAKEQERSQAAKECDHLTKELADQAKKHKAEVHRLKDGEVLLKAEFETRCSKRSEREKLLSAGYREIEDMVYGKSLLLLLYCCGSRLLASNSLIFFLYKIPSRPLRRRQPFFR